MCLQPEHLKHLGHLFPLPDFGIAGHFINRVVDVHGVLDHCAVLKHLDLLGHTGNSKVVTVTVKLNTETQDRILVRMDTKNSITTLISHIEPSKIKGTKCVGLVFKVILCIFCTWRQYWSRCTGRWRTRGWRAAAQSCSG